MNKVRFAVAVFAGINYFIVSVYGQGQPSYSNLNIASPTAASIGKFGDIPVSTNTGIPQINIPIYTVTDGPLTLPISLNYHAGGIKVMEPAGWVGAGWALNAGGVITRTVRGMADEATASNCAWGHFSHYGYLNYFTESGGVGLGTSGLSINDPAFVNGTMDGEPDLFSFNFLGYSGNFFFRDDRTPVIMDGQNIKIDFYYPADNTTSTNAYFANIQGFLLTTADGTKFYFGIHPNQSTEGDPPIEITFPYADQNQNLTDRVFSSWYLTKITSADGMFNINLSYTSEKYSYYTLSMFPIQGNLPIPDHEYALTKMFIDGVRINQISTTNTNVVFNSATSLRTDLGNDLYNGIHFEQDYPNTQARALDNITITNNRNFCKKYKLAYSYFVDNTTSLKGDLINYPALHTDQTRLKLNSVQELSCDNEIVNPPYIFNYYSNFLPRRLSFAQDHWGFYNGVDNQALIPTYSINTYQFQDGADRESKWPDMQNGALTRIQFPSGGFSSFEFESNTTWVNTTQNTPIARYNYSVGYDGNQTSDFTSQYFSNNRYQLIIRNSGCPSWASTCSAHAYLISSTNVTYDLGGCDANGNADFSFQVPAGNYTIHLTRTAAQTGTGAEFKFREIISTPLQTNAVVGGLRVKSITSYDGISFSNNVTKNFRYNYDNTQSSGVLYTRPIYVGIVRNNQIAEFGLAPANASDNINHTPNGCLGRVDLGAATQWIKSPAGIIPMANVQGNHIGYNEVRVSQIGNGYTIYRYYGSDAWDNIFSDVCFRNVNPTDCDPNFPSLPAPPLRYEFQRGQLKYEGHFNEVGEIIKYASYSYYFDSSTVTTPAFKVQNIIGSGLNTLYEIRGYWKTRTQTIIRDYNPGNSALLKTNTIYYESPYHHLPSRQEINTSLGETLKTTYKYASDFRMSNCESISNCEANLVSSCNSCDVIRYNTTSNCTSRGCRYWAYVDNLVCRANARKTFVNCRNANFNNSNSAFKTCLANAKANADVLLKPILELQDEFNLSPIETASFKGALLMGASFNQFTVASTPSNFAYPNLSKQINLTTPSASFTQAATSSNNQSIVTDSRYEDEALIGMKNGNVSNVTPRSGLTTGYLWGYNNSQPIAKVVNALPSEIAYTSFENGPSEGNFLISDITGSTSSYQISGNQAYTLSSGRSITSTPATGKSYTLSYWSRNGAVTVKANSVNVSVSKTGETRKGFTYYEHQLPNTTNAVEVTGTNAVIDELRLYPKGAQMSTFTYDPVVGMTTTCDERNKMTYFSYDKLGRMEVQKDESGNVIKTYKYHYKNQ